MNVHTHHVSQSVRQEHGVCTCCNGLVGIAFHQADLLQSLRHQTAHGKMYIHILYAWLGNLKYVVVTFLHNLIKFQLALGELARYWHGSRVVGTVVVEFTSCITNHQSSRF